MKQSIHHKWDLSPDEASDLQRSLAEGIARDDRFSPIRYVAGVDVAYESEGDRVFAGAVVLDASSLAVVETATFAGVVTFPYVAGLFSFRELPSLCEVLQTLHLSPDLIVCDGQGIAHPRRCGLASHLGLLFDVPTIGCGKTCLLGDYSPPATGRGAFSELVDRDEVIGSVLRTQTDVKPVFVSIGHRISLATAREWILRLAPQFRQPEPIRRANEIVNQLRNRGI